MERWFGRLALVTGASAGCGARIAASLVQHGMTVIGCARNVTTIEELSTSLKGENGKLCAMKCDVSCDEDVKALFATIKKDYGRLDVCINNAGMSYDAPLLSGATEQWRTMLEVNVLAVSVFTREAVQLFQECGVDDGHVININSIAGHKVGPAADTHMYAATKFAVTALTEGTRAELRKLKSKIRVTQISPGLIETEFRQRMHGMTAEQTKEFYSQRASLTTDDVSEAVIYAISAPQHVQVHDILISHVDA